MLARTETSYASSQSRPGPIAFAGGVARHLRHDPQRSPRKPYPDDVARLLLRLAADDSRSCTPQRWAEDGGRM